MKGLLVLVGSVVTFGVGFVVGVFAQHKATKKIEDEFIETLIAH